jgi:uncharacterized protein (TIGR00303 family)
LHDISSTSDKAGLGEFAAKNPLFVCVISYTATSEIPGLTVAGANPELIKFTPPADAEFLHYGKCKCIEAVPATPDGKPTPALITRAALQAAEIPLLVVDAGAKIKPSIPYVSLGIEAGKNIVKENAMDESSARTVFDRGATLGRQLAGMSDLIVVGESIPGGTTTALAVLSALGIDAKFKVSSSMPENPHDLKNKVVASAMKRAGSSNGVAHLPFEAIAKFGDPMIPSVAGIASGVLDAGGRVMLAGGTQMSAVVAIMAHIGRPLGRRLCIGTTSYVVKDPSADLAGLVRSVGHVPILSCDLHLGESSKPGLQAFAKGFVKEGVGAGGASIAAMLKSKGKITAKKLLRAIEKEYETSIESRL